MPLDDEKRRLTNRSAALRAAALRPIQLWVPDTREPGFTEEARRQCAVVAAADSEDQQLLGFMDAALLDLDGEAQSGS